MKTETYLQTISAKETDPFSVSLRHQAEQAEIPIIQYEGLCLLRQIILLGDLRRVLELGTAIGYSAIGMAKARDAVHITTIERDPHMCALATKSIELAGLQTRITLIEGDARSLDLSVLKGPYDLIFIDASKSQGIHYFERYETLLSDKGVIVTDNRLFHGLHEVPIRSRNLRQLMKKIDLFNRYLLTRADYDSVIYPVGDGMSVSIKRS